MIESFMGELEKLSKHFGIPIDLIASAKSANSRFIATTEFLSEVNKKLGPPKKAKKAKDE